jgi:hypothetical protein
MILLRSKAFHSHKLSIERGKKHIRRELFFQTVLKILGRVKKLNKWVSVIQKENQVRFIRPSQDNNYSGSELWF